MVPVFGMSASALMLGEPMPWWKLTASALIMAGLVLNLGRAGNRAAKEKNRQPC